MSANSEPLIIPEEISIRSLASLVNEQPTALITKLMANGVFASINQNLDYDTAALLVEEFGFTATKEEKNTQIQKNIEGKNAITRAPIVTIMGHVDHGKTSLLDYIRHSNITATESGGITQHISAYQIEFTTSDKQKRKITFVDTPGHEAFSALRSHGASITDVVILVVAADDGVKPQTIEVIEHAKKANVPVVVAINKSELPSANIDRVKQQLVENGLSPEDWGGKTITVPVSAKTGAGIDNLLEMVLLTTDLLEIKADPEASAEGIVIEGNLDKAAGPTATVLIYNGTLRPGQVVVVGKTYGRIRSLENDRAERISLAPPSTPVRLLGLREVPLFGDRLEVVPNEKVARTMTLQTDHAGTRGEEDSSFRLNVVLKVDVGGSLAALEDSLSKLKFKDATVNIISSGIGAPNDNDVITAKTANAILFSFRQPVQKRIRELCEADSVMLREEWVIYDIIEYCQEQLKSIASPVFVTEEIGRLKVLAVFSRKKNEAIVGGEVSEGEISPADIEIFREKEKVGSAKAQSVKIGKVDVDKADKGDQCGIAVTENEGMIEVGDVLVFSKTRQE